MGAKPLRDRKPEGLEARSGALSGSTRREDEKAAFLLRWISKPMGALVDLEDKEALYAILDHEGRVGL
jgi:hypothetical protein